MNNNISKTSNIINSKINDSASCYKYSRIRNSLLRNFSSVGDFSKIENSKLERYSRIGRNNHVENSKIGAHSYTGMNTIIIDSTVGKFNSISWGVTIGPGEHDYTKTTNHSFLYNDYSKIKPLNYRGYDRYIKECIIGNDVWIGCNVTVLRGVKIGNGAVIGANSVVTKDIPSYAIAVGSPAKIIKYRFSEDIISLLEKMKWWEWSEDKISKNIDFFNSNPTKEKLKKLLKERSDNENTI